MELPKFFELTGSSRDGTNSEFRLYVELTDEDKDFWESQLLDTLEGRSRMDAEKLTRGIADWDPAFQVSRGELFRISYRHNHREFGTGHHKGRAQSLDK
jgi:hypothetical protein